MNLRRYVQVIIKRLTWLYRCNISLKESQRNVTYRSLFKWITYKTYVAKTEALREWEIADTEDIKQNPSWEIMELEWEVLMSMLSPDESIYISIKSSIHFQLHKNILYNQNLFTSLIDFWF